MITNWLANKYRAGIMGPGHINKLDTVVTSGSDSNGEWVRFADGTQVCRKSVELTFSTEDKLQGSWTFGKSFIARPMVHATVDLDNYEATPLDISIGMVAAASIGTTSCVPFMLRITGSTGFISGDTAVIFVEAAGYWK